MTRFYNYIFFIFKLSPIYTFCGPIIIKSRSIDQPAPQDVHTTSNHQFNLPMDHHIYLPSQLANSKLDDDDTIVTRQDQGDFWPWILAPDWRYGRQIWSSRNIPYLVLLMNPIFIYCNQILVFQATIDDGFVTIRGRIKDVIITSGGKNISLKNINWFKNIFLRKNIAPNIVN